VLAAAVAAAPPPLIVTLARPGQTEYGWTSLRPQEVRFVEPFLKEGNEAAILSSLREAHVVLRASAAEARAQMAALEPKLVSLQNDIARFADHLGKRRIEHADLSK
jgi:hypothetical protein